MERLILTMAVGPKHKAISDVTLPTLKAYAKRIGAKLRCVREHEGELSPHFRKLELMREELENNARVAWIDTDILISPKAPDIFEEVPEDKLGLFNEAPWVGDRHPNDIAVWKELTGRELVPGQYFNTGVIVASMRHADLFDTSVMNKVNHYGEQTAFNQLLVDRKAEVFELSHEWNRMSCTWRQGLSPYSANFVHVAGAAPEIVGGVPQMLKNIWADWKAQGFEGRNKIFILCSGGMGNQIASLAAIREMIRLYPDSEFGIMSAYPQVFRHLEKLDRVRVEFMQIGGEQERELELRRRYQFAWITTTARPVGDTTQMRSVDYHALSLLGRQIVNPDMWFPPAVISLPGDFRRVVIHAGFNAWKSKDVPRELYQDVLDGLQELGHDVAIIGKREFKEHGAGYGAYELEGADFNFMDVSLEETAAVIAKSGFLLSNDSAPVHLAAGFQTQIGVISIAKHPDLIFPPRTQGGRMHGFTGPIGTNQWELMPPRPFHFPFQKSATVADWVDGMQWPKAEEIVRTIHDALR